MSRVHTHTVRTHPSICHRVCKAIGTRIMAHHLKSTLWTYTLFKKYLQTYLPCQRWPAVQYHCPDRTRCAHYQSPHQYQRDPPFPPVAVCAHSRVPAMHKSIKINWHISAIDAFHVALSHSQFAVLSMRGAHISFMSFRVLRCHPGTIHLRAASRHSFLQALKLTTSLTGPFSSLIDCRES